MHNMPYLMQCLVVFIAYLLILACMMPLDKILGDILGDNEDNES